MATQAAFHCVGLSVAARRGGPPIHTVCIEGQARGLLLRLWDCKIWSWVAVQQCSKAHPSSLPDFASTRQPCRFPSALLQSCVLCHEFVCILSPNHSHSAEEMSVLEWKPLTRVCMPSAGCRRLEPGGYSVALQCRGALPSPEMPAARFLCPGNSNHLF